MQHLKEYLDLKVEKYNCIEFIENDPISIPHRYSLKEDIEIAGLLCATIAWGNRKAILKAANKLMQWMDNSPYDFIINHSATDLKPFEKFVYRTFNGDDCLFFIKAIQYIYTNHNGLENTFNQGFAKEKSIEGAIAHFRNVFLTLPHFSRINKHLANPVKGSAAKRLNMYLRWMVRNDIKRVDFGLWKTIKPSELMMPLDVHSGTVARTLELLKRNANDWKAVVELTQNLKMFDPSDPVKYDFALFGMGVNNDF